MFIAQTHLSIVVNVDIGTKYLAVVWACVSYGVNAIARNWSVSGLVVGRRISIRLAYPTESSDTWMLIAMPITAAVMFVLINCTTIYGSRSLLDSNAWDLDIKTVLISQSPAWFACTAP